MHITLTINAIFETSDGKLTGHTNAPIKRIEQQDDGSFTVVIDHWPAKVTKPTSSVEDLVVWPDGSMCPRNELSQYQWKGDDYEFVYYGSGAWQALSNI